MKGCKLEYSTYNPKGVCVSPGSRDWHHEQKSFCQAWSSYSHQQIKTEFLEMSFIRSGQHSKPMKHFTIANPIQGHLQYYVNSKLKKRRHFCKAGEQSINFITGHYPALKTLKYMEREPADRAFWILSPRGYPILSYCSLCSKSHLAYDHCLDSLKRNTKFYYSKNRGIVYYTYRQGSF